MRFAYREVAPPVRAFGNLVAQCFETQAVIALVNCTLTTLGLYLLKVRMIIHLTTCELIIGCSRLNLAYST